MGTCWGVSFPYLLETKGLGALVCVLRLLLAGREHRSEFRRPGGPMLRTSDTSAGATLGRAALIVAHPGHELNLMGWLTMSQPSVFVMTDGSGQLGRSRLHSTTKTLLRSGARPGPMYGHLSDQEVYEAMLDQDVDLFVRLTVELAESLCLDDV